MAVTSSPASKTANVFIKRIARDYPDITFMPGEREHWSPKTNTITFNPKEKLEELRYGLLHELAHALLDHESWHSDIDLLKLETQAWDLAAKISKKYKINLDSDHIQDCLDTYRDWLHRRSACPVCGMHTAQKDAHTYHCFNCQTQWAVSSDRFVRSYRRLHRQ